MSFKNESEIITFSDKRKLWEFIVRQLVLKIAIQSYSGISKMVSNDKTLDQRKLLRVRGILHNKKKVNSLKNTQYITCMH